MKSKRIHLRPIAIKDTKIYYESTQSEEIMYMTGTQQTFTFEQIEEHIKTIIVDDSREDYAICFNKTNEMVGELSIMDIDKRNSAAAFRISMNSTKYTGIGLGSEAIDLIVDYVFNSLNLNRLQLEVYSHNPRGIRAYEKAGFIKEGVLREKLLYNGKYSDEIIMSILKKDYNNQ
ncbi:GNAT family N-acetyltransferase [Marinilactibacillus kalidii]|uniref:GNAT family N-acetyltransferase n=1 Tax=Marinilactibacillus kalidii TaxID=2820274 RepID=UPI001ABDCACA|nr:GNAT family protein [Marinilactibacillus kalidii]